MPYNKFSIGPNCIPGFGISGDELGLMEVLMNALKAFYASLIGTHSWIEVLVSLLVG